MVNLEQSSSGLHCIGVVFNLELIPGKQFKKTIVNIISDGHWIPHFGLSALGSVVKIVI